MRGGLIFKGQQAKVWKHCTKLFSLYGAFHGRINLLGDLGALNRQKYVWPLLIF